MVETLKEAIDTHRQKSEPTYSEKGVCDDLEKLLRNTPFKCEKKKWTLTVQALVDKYFRIQLGQRYHCISNKSVNKITDLSQTVRLKEVRNLDLFGDENSYEKVTLKFPVFASVNYGDQEWNYSGEADGIGWTVYFDGTPVKERQKIKFNLRARVPQLTADAKRNAKEARGNICEILTTAYRHPLIGDLINTEEYDASRPEYGNLTIMWKPNPKEFGIDVSTLPDKYAALMFSFRRDLYFITAWKICEADATPALPKEFSSGGD